MTVFEITDLDTSYLGLVTAIVPLAQTAYRQKQHSGQRVAREINTKYNFNKQN